MFGARHWLGELFLHMPAPVRRLRGLPLLGDFVHRVSHAVLSSDELVWAQVAAGPARGIWLELSPRTGQGYLHGEVEQAVQQVLVEQVRPATVFYDLGANIGLFSVLASRLVGENGKVFSFEPDAEAAARLRRNIKRNGCQNITVIEKGVWSSNSVISFVAADASSPDRGVGKFSPGERSGADGGKACVSLDSFVESAPPPDAIKCDVEGAEVEVFRGAEKLLETHHPWIICEVHSNAGEATVRPQLERFGYAVQPADANHLLALPRPDAGTA
jgi:FkbM family methyltransferase